MLSRASWTTLFRARGCISLALCRCASDTTTTSEGQLPKGSVDVPVSRVDFRNLGPWEQIRSTLLLLKSDVRIRELTEALNVMKRKGTPAPPSFLAEIRDLILDRMDQVRPREATDIMHSCIKLDFIDPALFTAIGKCITENALCSMKGFDNREVSTLLYSLGKVRCHCQDKAAPTIIPDAIFSELLKLAVNELRLPHRMTLSEPRSLITSLHAFVFLGSTEGEDVIRQLIEVIFSPDILAKLTEEEFSVFLVALDELEQRCSTDQWVMIADELRKESRLKSFTRLSSVNVLRRLATMGFPYRDVMLSLASESTDINKLTRYNGQDLANLIHTIAVCDLHPEKNLEHFEPYVTRPTVLMNFKEQELSNIIYGFALTKNEQKAPLFQILGREAVRKKRLTRYTSQGLSLIIYSFGLVRFLDVPILVALSEECLKPERLGAFSEQALSNIIYGLGRLKVRYNALKVFANQLLIEASKPSRVKAFNEQALANLLYSIAYLHMPQFTRPFLEEICRSERLSRLNDQGLSNIIQGLGRLNYQYAKIIEILLTEAAKRVRQGRFSDMATSNVLAALVGLGIKDPSLLAPFLKKNTGRDQYKNETTKSLMAKLEKYIHLEIRDYAYVNPILMEITRHERLQELTDDQVITNLKRIWQFGMPSSNAIEPLVQELMRRASSLSPRMTADALIVLAWLEYPNPNFFTELIQMLNRGDEVLSQLATSQILQILQSLKPSLIASESVEFLGAYICQPSVLRRLEDRALPSLLRFHVAFGIRDEKYIKNCLAEMTEKNRLSNMTLKDGAIALECLISLGLQDSEGTEKLIERLKQPSLLENCRVHYLAKLALCLCRLGTENKRSAKDYIAKIVSPPWSQSISEKDLAELLMVVKEVGYEYGKLGGLLNRRRRDAKASAFLTEPAL